MSIRKKSVEKAQGFLDRMKMSNPASYALAEKYALNDDGAIDIKTFVMLGFGAVIVGAFIPMGLDALGSADTSNFTNTELALYSIVGVAILIAVVMVFVNIAT